MTSVHKLLLLFLFFAITAKGFSQSFQTLATVKIDDKKYHLHLVQSGETVYRIAQFYKVGVQDVLQSNPWGADTILMIGQVLKVPVEPLQNIPKVQEFKPAPPIKSAGQLEFIVVEQGHTLFGIAREYQLSVAQLQQWNKLDSLNIRIGDTLYLRPPGASPAKATTAGKPVKQDVPLIEKPLSVAIQQDIQSKAALAPEKTGSLAEQFRSGQNDGKSLLSQRGSAGNLSTTNASMKSSFYCLHRSAPIGSVIRVQSLVTNKTTFVKVLGKLPDTEDNKPFMLRLSEAAVSELGITMEKTFVEASYYE
jgi:LysM repeat protein